MSFGEILVHVRDCTRVSHAVVHALRFAQAFQAHVTGLHVVPLDPPAAFTLPEVGALDYLASDREVEAALKRREWWDGVLREHGVQGEWHVAQGDCVEALCHGARFADVLVAELFHASPNTPLGWGPIERALFGTGIPTMLVPDKPALPTFAQSIAIAWNGSREAARAVHAALPLLERAGRVLLLRGTEKPTMVRARRLPLLDVKAHLKRHGVQVESRPLETDPLDAGAAILRAAERAGADLIVMGAWGRSRISELALGGATRYMLRESPVPLFVAH